MAGNYVSEVALLDVLSEHGGVILRKGLFTHQLPSSLRQHGAVTLSYDPFSTTMIFSTPGAFAASSAIDLTLLPAMKPVTGPPSRWAAVTALSEFLFNCPSLCSRIASVLSRWEGLDWRARKLLLGCIWLLPYVNSEVRQGNMMVKQCHAPENDSSRLLPIRWWPRYIGTSGITGPKN